MTPTQAGRLAAATARYDRAVEAAQAEWDRVRAQIDAESESAEELQRSLE